MSAQESILAELLGQTPVQQFFAEHYLKLPFARREGCLELQSAGSWQVLGGILQGASADVIVGRSGTQHPGPAPQTLQAAEELLETGFTIGIRHAEKHHPALAALANRFEQALQAAIDIHMYCTPGGQPGFGWHYDAEEVFVLQTAGEKDWYLRKNTVNPLPLLETIPKNQRYERELMPVMQCKLTAGDWLYVPSGYWHKTSADVRSISLSVGVKSITAIDFYDFMRSQLLESIFWRQRLPCLGSATGLTAEQQLADYRSRIQSLAQEFAQTMCSDYSIQRFIDAQARQTMPPPNS